METLISTNGTDRPPPARLGLPRGNGAATGHGAQHAHRSRIIEAGRLAAYYLALLAVTVPLIVLVPTVRAALVSPLIGDAGSVGDLLTGVEPAGGAGDALGVLDRALRTLIVMLAAPALVLPVAWIYMKTKRLRYDPSLVQSVIVLPIVMAGILMVAKNSIAVAFGLVGIVAAVRFRNTLEDPKDAVYVFLALAMGVAAGVQALDVALVTSLTFNVLILFLWRFNVGSVYGGRYGRTGIISVGDPRLLLGREMDDRRRIRLHLRRDARKIRSDAVLLVHAADSKRAQRAVEESLQHDARDWRLVEVMAREDGYSTLEYVLRLKRSSDPFELVTDLDDRWSEQIAGIEYLPFRIRK